MNFGPRVGLNGWGGPNIGKQVILRTRKPWNIVPHPISRTYGPRNTKTNTYTYAYAYILEEGPPPGNHFEDWASQGFVVSSDAVRIFIVCVEAHFEAWFAGGALHASFSILSGCRFTLFLFASLHVQQDLKWILLFTLFIRFPSFSCCFCLLPCTCKKI